MSFFLDQCPLQRSPVSLLPSFLLVQTVEEQRRFNRLPPPLRDNGWTKLNCTRKNSATPHSIVTEEMQLQVCIMSTLNIYQAHLDRCMCTGHFILMPSALLPYDEIRGNHICSSLPNSPCIYIDIILPTNISTGTTRRECIYMNTVYREKLCLRFFRNGCLKLDLQIHIEI